MAAPGVGLLLTALAATPAEAANRYSVRSDVPKPTAACNNVGTLPQGAWLSNKPCGYIVGTALAGTSFDNHRNSEAGFHYGRARTSAGNFCAWTLPKSLEPSSRRTVADSCSSATDEAIRHRRTIGRDFDNEPGEGNGRPTIPVDASACTGYYNYFTSSTYETGRLHDPIGRSLPSTGAYRFSTNDRRAAMIRVGTGDATTWLFVDRSCIEPQLAGKTLYNSND